MSQPEAWLLGRVEGVSDAMMPVAHSLVQARRELLMLQEELITPEFLASPGGAASIGFHIAHITGYFPMHEANSSLSHSEAISNMKTRSPTIRG